jgi:hypothetical protein
MEESGKFLATFKAYPLSDHCSICGAERSHILRRASLCGQCALDIRSPALKCAARCYCGWCTKTEQQNVKYVVEMIFSYSANAEAEPCFRYMCKEGYEAWFMERAIKYKS